jgi:hypothetical protein
MIGSYLHVPSSQLTPFETDGDSWFRSSSMGSWLLEYAFFCRPVTKFVKLIHRIFYGKSRQHSIDLWPYLKLQHDMHGMLERLKINNHSIPIIPITPVREASAADSILHLIATGPSVANIDYSRISSGVFMGVNGAIALAQKFSLRFDYYVISDYTFVTDRTEIVAQVLSQSTAILFTTPKCLLYIYKLLGSEAVLCRVCVIELIGKQYNKSNQEARSAARSDPEMVVSENSSIGFSQHVGRGVYEGGTVAYVALQIAAFIGYQNIYLHGVDLGNANQVPRFYETFLDRAKSNLVAELDSIILPSFRLAAPLLRARGISVYNLSPHSSLAETIFQKVDARSLYV